MAFPRDGENIMKIAWPANTAATSTMGVVNAAAAISERSRNKLPSCEMF